MATFANLVKSVPMSRTLLIFIQEAFVKCLLWTRHCVRHCGSLHELTEGAHRLAGPMSTNQSVTGVHVQVD